MSKNKVNSIDKINGIRDIPSEYKKYYVVLRNNRRVSDKNHLTIPEATSEKKYWDGILHAYPDGTRMSIFTCENPAFADQLRSLEDLNGSSN